MKSAKVLMLMAVVFSSGAALAQESEFRGKMKEDLDYYVKGFENYCGIKATVEWTGGKFGHNPRSSEKEGQHALSTLCTVAMDAVHNACGNAVVKEALAKVTKVQCTRGKGAINYKLSGDTLTITVDNSYVDDNPAGQRDDLTEKMKKELDI